MVSVSKFVPRTGHSTGAAAADGAPGGTRGPQPNRAWAGRGSGALCDLCHQTIDEDQIEYEVELPETRNRILTLHLDCYERWVVSGDALDV
jgi:hypothetical protein